MGRPSANKKIKSIIFLTILLVILSDSASRAFFDHSNKPRSEFLVTKEADYQILFFYDGNELVTENAAHRNHYRKISYKLVHLNDVPNKYFGESGFARVALKDTRGFILAGDVINRGELIAEQEYYGAIWVDESKAKEVEQAALLPLRDRDLDLAIEKERQVYYFIRNFVDPDEQFIQDKVQPKTSSKQESGRDLASESKTSPAPTETAAAVSLQPQPAAPNPTPASAPQTTNASAAPAFGKGPITNEMVARTLQDYEKTPPTLVEKQ